MREPSSFSQPQRQRCRVRSDGGGENDSSFAAGVRSQHWGLADSGTATPRGSVHLASHGRSTTQEGGNWAARRCNVTVTPSRPAPLPPAPSTLPPPPPPTDLSRTLGHFTPAVPTAASNVAVGARARPTHKQRPQEASGEEDIDDPLTALLSRVRAAQAGGGQLSNAGRAVAKAAPNSVASPQEGSVSDGGRVIGLSFPPTHIDGGALGQLHRLREAVKKNVVSTRDVYGGGAIVRAAEALEGSLAGGAVYFQGKGPAPAPLPPSALLSAAADDVLATLNEKLSATEHAMALHQNHHIMGRAAAVRDVDAAKAAAEDCEFRLAEVEAAAEAKLAALRARLESRLTTAQHARELWVLNTKNEAAAEVRAHAATLGVGGVGPHGASRQGFRQQLEALQEVLLQYSTHADARMTALEIDLTQRLTDLQSQLKGASYLVSRRGGLGGGRAGPTKGIPTASPDASASVGPLHVVERLATRLANVTPPQSPLLAPSVPNASNVGSSPDALPFPHHAADDGKAANALWLRSVGDSLSSPISAGGRLFASASATTLGALGGGHSASLEDCRARFLEAVGRVRLELSQLRRERVQFEAHFLDRIAEFAMRGNAGTSDGSVLLDARGLVAATSARPTGVSKPAAHNYSF